MQDVSIFLFGYALLLLMPGPNMAMVVSITVLGGPHAVAYLIAGLCIGAALLVTFMMVSGAALVQVAGLSVVGPLVSALALAFMGWSVAPKSKMVTAGAAKAGSSKLAGFSCGLWTATTNPITGTYFASQFLQPGSTLSSGFSAVAVVVGVLVLCALIFIVVATVFSTETARIGALRYEFALRRAITAIFTGLSVQTLLQVVPIGPVNDVVGKFAPVQLALSPLVVIATYLWLAPKTAEPSPALVPNQQEPAPNRVEPAQSASRSKRARRRIRGRATQRAICVGFGVSGDSHR